MKDITVIILAAGSSSRLWPLEEKHFVRFFGRPLVYYSIQQLVKFGFTNIVIVVNTENKPLFEKLIKEFKNVSFHLALQKEVKGMAAAIISASEYILGKKLLVVGPSDIYEDILLSDFIKLLKDDPNGILAGTVTDKYFPGGYLTIDKGIVTKIVEKPSPAVIPSNIVTFVFDYFKSGNDFIDAINKVQTKKDDIYEKAIVYLINSGWIFKFLKYTGYWGYLKYPWHILSLSSYFLERLEGKKIKKGEIAKSSIIDDKVLIEEGVQIMENVKIVGPSYIGRGTIIGDNCVIRDSIIGENCVVGFSSEIARSYIGDRCWFHHNYIGDSVLGTEVSMGAGAVCANFRFDERMICSDINGEAVNTGKTKLGAIIGNNVKIGVNASIMPGVKIGKNSFVGSGVVLERDLAANKYCSFIKGNYKITDNRLKR